MNDNNRQQQTRLTARSERPIQSAAHRLRRIERAVIARRLIGGVIVIAIISIAIAGIALWKLRQNTIASALAEVDAFDLLLSEQTERTFENVDLVLEGIIDDLHGQGITPDQAFGRFRATLLREKLAGVPQLDGISLVNAKGDVMSLTRVSPVPGINIADRDYFAAMRDHPDLSRMVSKPVLSRTTGAWTIYLARRISAPDGTFLGLVLGAMKLDYFKSFYHGLTPASARGINLWRTDGTLLMRYPFVEGAIGKVFDGLHDQFHRLATTGGSALFWTKGKFTVTTMVIAERKLQDFPLIVAVGVTKRSILASWYPQAIAMAAGIGVLLVSLAFAAWLFLRQLSAFALVTEARARASRATEARQESQRAVERAEHAVKDLRQSEARFRDIAEVSGDWIWESDRDHRMTSVLGDTLFTAERDGVSSAGAIGKTRWELAGADAACDEHWRAHKADLEAHRPFRNFRFRVISPNGQELHFCVSGKPVFDETGRFLGYRGIASNETGLVDALRRAEHAETLLREAIDNISEGFAIYDRDDRLVMCNEAYKEIYRESAAFIVPGATFEEVLRGGVARGQYADAVGREEEWIAERMRDHRELRETPFEQALPDGRWALVSDRRLSDGGRAGLRIDITALKKIQQSLAESEEQLARAQRVANTGSIERDLGSTQVEWSDETFRILGVERGTTAPTLAALIERIHPDDRARMAEMLAQSPSMHAGRKLQYRIVRPNGEIRSLYAESDVIPGKDGRPGRIVAVIRDITDAAHAAKRQSELEAQLRHSEKLTALGTLAGGIAHDLNNMLVPIQGLTKLVMRELPVGSAARADLETVIQASLQARDLVRQILAFSRKQEILKRPVDLVSVTREALQMLRASIPSTVELVEAFQPVPPMLADAGQLHQVIINLVSNAAHAIGDRMGRVTVKVAPAPPRPGDSAPGILLSVADTGCGMDPNSTQRIFEPFYTTKPVGEGTGLGLSVVHGIVTGHGGTIEVSSELGKGSEFVIRLPSCDASTNERVDAEAIA